MTSRTQRRIARRTIAVLAGIAVLASCDDPASPRGATPDDATAAARRPAPTAEQASMTELTRAVAIALGDERNRARLKDDLRASRATHEHKLHLSEYLKGQRGGALAASIARAAGKNRDELLAQVAKLRTMELYMPVEAHRAAWTGGNELIVASQLKEREDPVGFRLDGTPVTLTEAGPPTTPTLAIVPAETDFAADLVPAEWRNTDDRGGEAIGTLRGVGAAGRSGARPANESQNGISMMFAIPEDPCAVDPYGCLPPPPPPVPPGTYLDFSHIDDLGESWIRGSPEIEFHLIAPTAFEGNDGEHLSCSGERVSGPKWFNQDGHDWRRYGATGAMFLKTDYDQYYVVYTDAKPIGYQVWEDDNGDCVIRGDMNRDEVLTFYREMRRIYAATAIIVQILSANVWTFSSAAVTTIQGAFQSDDDFLGIAIAQQNAGYNYSDATHVIMRPLRYLWNYQVVLNGRIRLVNITQ